MAAPQGDDAPDLLRRLLEGIRSGRPAAIWNATGENVDGLLDERDVDPFDGDWGREHDVVQPMLRELGSTAAEKELVAAVAEEAFMIAAATYGDGAAPYVSDDFRLIAEALVVGYESPWISGLLDAYRRGRLPTGQLTLVQRSLPEIVAHDLA